MSQHPPKSEPNLRPKKNGWEARAMVAGKAYSAYGSSKQEAAERLEEKVIGFQPLQVETHSLRSYMATAYWQSVETQRDKTKEKIQWAMKHLGRLGDIPLDQINRTVLQSHVNAKSKTHSPGTVRTMMQPVGAAMNLAEADGLIPHNPMRHVKFPAKESKAKVTLTADEVKRLWNATRGHSCHSLAILGCGCGLRVGEVRGLTAKDFGEGTLRVQGTKTHASVREIPLHPLLHSELAGLPFPLVPKWNTACTNALKRAAARAGIAKHVHPHMLRHTFATLLQYLGCPIEIRARLLGHAKGDVTQGYSHAEWQEWSLWTSKLVSYVYGELGTELGNAPRIAVESGQIS